MSLAHLVKYHQDYLEAELREVYYQHHLLQLLILNHRHLIHLLKQYQYLNFFHHHHQHL